MHVFLALHVLSHCVITFFKCVTTFKCVFFLCSTGPFFFFLTFYVSSMIVFGLAYLHLFWSHAIFFNIFLFWNNCGELISAPWWELDHHIHSMLFLLYIFHCCHLPTLAITHEYIIEFQVLFIQFYSEHGYDELRSSKSVCAYYYTIIHGLSYFTQSYPLSNKILMLCCMFYCRGSCA